MLGVKAPWSCIKRDFWKYFSYILGIAGSHLVPFISAQYEDQIATYLGKNVINTLKPKRLHSLRDL